MAVVLADVILTLARYGIMCLGLMGNLISFLVFLRPAFRSNSISTYCQALSLADSHILWEVVVDTGLIFYQTYFPNASNSICKIHFYVTLGLSSIPGWILVAFSVDKAITMRKPPQSHSLLKKKWFQWTIVAGISLLNCLLYAEIPILLTVQPYSSGFYCDMATMKYFQAVMILYLFESGLIPFGVMIVSSVLMIVWIRRSTKRIERGGKLDSQRRSRDVKFAVSSLAFNLVYVLFKTPVVVLYLLSGYDINVASWVGTFSLFMFFANSSISFVVHFASNSLFRRELASLLRLRSNRLVHTDVNDHNSSSAIRTLQQQKTSLTAN